MLHKNDRGFTLTELLVAIVVGFVLIAAASATYISQNRTYVAQESVSEVNTQSKIAHDILADAVKRAGFGVPPEWNLNFTPINNTTDIIETSVVSAATTEAITILSGRMIGQLWPVGMDPNSGLACAPSADNAGGVFEINNSGNQYDIIWSGTERPNITDKRFLSIDSIEIVEVIGVANPGRTVTLRTPPTRQYLLTDELNEDDQCDTGRPVYLIEDTTFCVDASMTLRRIRRNANVANCTPTLTSDDQAIAENIEDLQFAYAVDANQDEIIDDLDGDNMITGADFVDGTLVANDADIRAIRINILARSDKGDIHYQGLGSVPAFIEDRPHVQAADNLKRRWWQSIAIMRNQ